MNLNHDVIELFANWFSKVSQEKNTYVSIENLTNWSYLSFCYRDFSKICLKFWSQNVGFDEDFEYGPLSYWFLSGFLSCCDYIRGSGMLQYVVKTMKDYTLFVRLLVVLSTLQLVHASWWSVLLSFFFNLGLRFI